MFTFSQVNFHNPVLSSFATDDWVSNESISTGSTSGAETTYRSRAHESTHGFFGGSYSISSVLYAMFCHLLSLTILNTLFYIFTPTPVSGSI